MLLHHVLVLGVLTSARLTKAAFPSAVASHCSTEHGSRSLSSVPSYTDTTTFTSISTVIVAPAPTLVTTAVLPEITATETFTRLAPRPTLLEDVLLAYQSEYILAHRHRTTPELSATSRLLSASFSASYPSTYQSAIVSVYATQNSSKGQPIADYQLLSSEVRASKYPEYVHCSRTITYISRTTLAASMKSSNTASGMPSVQTTAVSTTVYAAIHTQKPAATTTTLITVYTPAQLQAAKDKDEEL